MEYFYLLWFCFALLANRVSMYIFEVAGRFDGHSYLTRVNQADPDDLEEVTWEAARSICQSSGYEMVTLKRVAETVYVESLINGISDNFWLGGKQSLLVTPQWLADGSEVEEIIRIGSLELDGVEGCGGYRTDGLIYKGCHYKRPYACQASDGAITIHSSSPKTWYESKHACEIRGEILAKVTRHEPTQQFTPGQDYWVGFYNSTYVWNDGTEISHSNWDSASPSNTDEQCLSLRGNGKWGDVNCGYERRVICETDAQETTTDGIKTTAPILLETTTQAPTATLQQQTENASNTSTITNTVKIATSTATTGRQEITGNDDDFTTGARQDMTSEVDDSQIQMTSTTEIQAGKPSQALKDSTYLKSPYIYMYIGAGALLCLIFVIVIIMCVARRRRRDQRMRTSKEELADPEADAGVINAYDNNYHKGGMAGGMDGGMEGGMPVSNQLSERQSVYVGQQHVINEHCAY